MWFVSWSESFPGGLCDLVRAEGAVPMITWEPWHATVESIATGEFDSYINDFALAARNWGGRLFLRPMHEMNGNWYPWSGFYSGTGEVVAAWKRIYGIFSGVGATNVTFVWSINHRSVPSPEGWNRIENYYPGDAYVDWIGVDGYNWIGDSGEPTYESFSQLFSSVYATLEALASSKPLMISEFACAEGPDKDAWITNAFNSLKGSSFSKFKAFVWFNIIKERDWRVDSSPAALSAFSSSMLDDYFIESLP